MLKAISKEYYGPFCPILASFPRLFLIFTSYLRSSAEPPWLHMTWMGDRSTAEPWTAASQGLSTAGHWTAASQGLK